MTIPAAQNLFAQLPTSLPEELIDILVQNTQVRIERIVSTGQSSPPGFWYDQSEAEWVIVLQGEAELIFEQESAPVRLTPGDHLLIPAHVKHRVQSTSSAGPTVWLAVFFPTEIR